MTYFELPRVSTLFKQHLFCLDKQNNKFIYWTSCGSLKIELWETLVAEKNNITLKQWFYHKGWEWVSDSDCHYVIENYKK